LGTSAIFTSYLPSADLCIVEGNSFLYALNFRTGTAEKFAPFGQETGHAGVAAESVSLGVGAASAPVAIVSTGSDPGVNGASGGISIVTGSGTGTLNNTSYTPPPYESGRISWEQLDVPF
jgi:type IV pilus assembly protein PilY1